MQRIGFSEEAFDEELRSLVAAGQKIEAVKQNRQRTGTGLTEVKKAVALPG